MVSEIDNSGTTSFGKYIFWIVLKYGWKLCCKPYHNIAFVNSERWLAKSRVAITQCQHGNFGKFLSLYFFVLYYKTNIKHIYKQYS